MKNFWTTMLCALLALAIAFSFACAASAFADVSDEVTIAVMDKGRVAASEGNMEENRWTTWMREQTGLNLKWKSLPRNGFRDSIGELVALGEAPDIIVEFDQTFFANMASEGLIIPLDDVLQEYAPNYYKFMTENDDIRKATTFYDGHIYALTSFSGTKLSEVLWIRQDWLDELVKLAHMNCPLNVIICYNNFCGSRACINTNITISFEIFKIFFWYLAFFMS